MILTALKHFIYEICIDVFFDKIYINFLPPIIASCLPRHVRYLDTVATEIMMGDIQVTRAFQSAYITLSDLILHSHRTNVDWYAFEVVNVLKNMQSAITTHRTRHGI